MQFQILPTILKTILLCLLVSISTATLAIEKIQLQGMFSGKAVINIDGRNRILAIGETSPEGITLVSISTDSVILKVDNKTDEYHLGAAIGLDYKVPEDVEEKFYSDDQGMFEAVGTINSHTVRFLLDTGATLVTMNRAQAKQLGIRYRLNGEPSGVSTASGYEKAYRVQLKSVSLGKIKQRNVDAIVIDGNHPGPILLGMSFLGKLKVEKAGNSLLLKQRK
jgi:aspartyl protease family protein